MNGILLTGATGLIGAGIYQKLSQSYEIVRLGRRAECELHADLSQPATLEGLRFGNCETVIHCAGVTDEDFKLRPVDAFIQSTLGMNTLIQTAIENRVRRFIYISTSHVYGLQTGFIDEGTSANPISDYAIAHYAAEQILRRNSKDIGSCWVLRPNAVFGEPALINNFDRWSLIPYCFPIEAVYNKKIVLRSSGEQKRNFVAVEDIIYCIEGLLDSDTKENFAIVNPLGKETLSVYQFAEQTAEVFRELTGENCLVERPSLRNISPEEEFTYQSKFAFSSGKSHLKTYLRKFLSRIIEDNKNGKRYVA